jgi:lysophospholipase L1-like esterase
MLVNEASVLRSYGTITPMINSRRLSLLLLIVNAAWANPAIEPAPRDTAWIARHEGFVAEAHRGGIELLFLGDSITDNWRAANPEKGGKTVWDREYAALKAANFGIGGDRTQHVLWRLRNGEADGYQPKVVVLMIGTNNTGLERDGKTPRNATPEVIEGVTAVVSELRIRFPESKILFLAIFPRGEKAAPQRAQVAEVNRAIARLHDGKHVFFLNIGARFLDADGNIPHDVMPDLLHPSEKGYQIWADAIREPLKALLR